MRSNQIEPAQLGRRDVTQVASVEALLGGLVGALLAWGLIEKTGWFSLVLYGSGSLTSGSRRLMEQIALGGVFGLCVGAGISVPQRIGDAIGLQSGARIASAAVLGLIGGCFGIWVGQLTYDSLLSHAGAQNIITLGLAARCAGWGIIGLLLGASQGIIRGAGRLITLGALGGFCGGLAGGAVFQALELMAFYPPIARLIGFLFVGAATGFFLEAVPMLAQRKFAAAAIAATGVAMTIPPDTNDFYTPQLESSMHDLSAAASHHAPSYPAAQLVGVEGPYAGIIFPLRDSRADLVIGRLTDCDVCLMNDRTISRRHALLRRDETSGSFRVEDLRSANGTGINNVRLRPNQAQILTMRDLINLGTSTLRFEWIGPAPAP